MKSKKLLTDQIVLSKLSTEELDNNEVYVTLINNNIYTLKQYKIHYINTMMHNYTQNINYNLWRLSYFTNTALIITCILINSESHTVLATLSINA